MSRIGVLESSPAMVMGHAVRTGAALSATVAIGYTLCTLAFWAFPDASMNFMNALFHGLDFRSLRADIGITVGSFAYGLMVMAAWAFMLGASYGTIAEWIGSERRD